MRLFIAINLPKEVRYDLEARVEELRGRFPAEVRFLPSDTWHLTLTFLGEQKDEAIMPIIEAMQVIGPKFATPKIAFESITYGPPDKSPRMIWLNTNEATSVELGGLKSALEEELAGRGVRFDREHRRFHGHLTLARFAEGYRPDVKDLTASFKEKFIGASLDLMESTLARMGATYELLQAVRFGLK